MAQDASRLSKELPWVIVGTGLAVAIGSLIGAIGGMVLLAVTCAVVVGLLQQTLP